MPPFIGGICFLEGNMKKLCFVLGAGGARGIAHIGFLKAMEENGIYPDCIAGCSMGSVVGACYASGMKPDEMMEVVDSLKLSDIADASLFPFNKKSLFRSVKLRSKIDNILGGVTFSELKIPFECIAADINNCEIEVLKTGNVAEAVRASSSIPGVFNPVEKGDKVLVDGGIFMTLPLICIKDFKPDIVVVVDVLGGVKTHNDKEGLLSHVLRVVDANAVYLKKHQLKKYKHNVLVTPQLGDMSQYKVADLKWAYNQGYIAGIENIKKIKKLIED